MTYQTFLIIALLAISLASFAEAKDKCETMIDKNYLGDCKYSGDHPPEECRNGSAAGYDVECLSKGCAKECQERGGDEVLYYRKNADYDNFICCKSKTPEQTQKTLPSCQTCKLVNDFFPPSTTPTTPTTPTTTSTTPALPNDLSLDDLLLLLGSQPIAG